MWITAIILVSAIFTLMWGEEELQNGKELRQLKNTPNLLHLLYMEQNHLICCYTKIISETEHCKKIQDKITGDLLPNNIINGCMEKDSSEQAPQERGPVGGFCCFSDIVYLALPNQYYDLPMILDKTFFKVTLYVTPPLLLGYFSTI